jgi:hypothetical protein
MKTLILAIAALSLTACGRAPDSIDPSLQVYVDSFRSSAQLEGVQLVDFTLDVKFGEVVHDHLAGLCSPDTTVNTITVDPTYWKMLSPTTREALMFHELGHCLLGRSHDTTLNNSGRPAQIMHPSLVAEVDYLGHREELVHRLFHP